MINWWDEEEEVLRDEKGNQKSVRQGNKGRQERGAKERKEEGGVDREERERGGR